MLTIVVTTLVLIFIVAYGRVLLYNTENNQAVEKFDCVYHIYDNGEEIPYCRRLNGSHPLDRNGRECENQGETKMFRDLLDQGVKPSDVLSWSSSVEMADIYASVFYNRSLIDDDDDRFVCKCTKAGTFGKYCQYQLTHYATSFSKAIKAQFEEKKNGDSWDTQRYGKIVCYETLPCNSSVLCLDWREICDGTQRCSSGIDEENWDKLEFNECEDDEFRCTNGMCIPEEFWLDGDVDCMDWSDELPFGLEESCSFKPNAIDCDEHLCDLEMYSCGDGQCVPWMSRMAFQPLHPAHKDCFNKRNLNYMCETSPHRHAWTQDSGLCWPDADYNDLRYPPWNLVNSSTLTDDEKCQYLLRCILSDGFESDCPCNRNNCTQMMMSECSGRDRLVVYPPPRLINANLLFYYNYSRSMANPNVNGMIIGGNLKCRGYHLTTGWSLEIPSRLAIAYQRMNNFLCTFADHGIGYQDFSSPFQYHKFCWNESLTFNGRPYAVNPDTCLISRECISQYRIQDGSLNCLNREDEDRVFEHNYCTGNVGRHRFQCFDDQHKCLPLYSLGTGTAECSNNYDEMWYGLGSLETSITCWKGDTEDCGRLKEYIEKSSAKNSSSNSSLANSQEQTSTTGKIPFRSYCDSFWDLNEHIDELPSSCQYWVCQNHQYQCQTGQCIELDWVCDGEWDCSDASDEEALVLIKTWSTHNARLEGLDNRTEKCQERYSQSPFSTICNTSSEFGCYLSRVANPLDIESNHPCINLTQIGDGIENCYNAYDEKNTFEAKLSIRGMWGFRFRCGSSTSLYTDACTSRRRKNCTEILCSNHRDEDGSCSGNNDVICLEDNQCKKNARCNGIPDCFHGEDEYWCASNSYLAQILYRIDKELLTRNSQFNFFPRFPFQPIQEPHLRQARQLINPPQDPFPTMYSYQCNRGVAILELNETLCLCPPAYYGRWCEFFSDRISIIVHVDQKTSLSKNTLKIKTNLLFQNTIIDHHEFNFIPTFENTKNIKHKFYLLYSRSAHMLAHKRWRYFNRSDVINNHPYSVHFDAFSLEKNSRVREIGSWHYPIYFDYLPAFRLAVILRFPAWFGHVTLDLCWQNSCNENSTCMPIFNQNNSYYCSCKGGYYGENCSLYERQCETQCSANALCRRDHYELKTNKSQPYCICPLDHFGPRCYLKYDACHSNPCLNDGTCLSTYDRSGEISYMCICSQRFYGNRCEYAKASIHIVLNMTNASSALATVVQLYDITSPSFTLLTQHEHIYRGLPSKISYYHADRYAPYLGLLKIYKNFTDPEYFIMYILGEPMINITSSPEHCPHALSVLSEGEFLDRKNHTHWNAVLLSDTNRSVPPIFKYHQICRNDTQRFCFYDEHYLCICEPDQYRAECFGQDTQLDHCDHHCLSGGKCLRGDRKDPNDFICICPSCHRGHRCEINLEPFGFTLDSLLVYFRKEVKIIYVSIVCILFTIGLLNNLCSFVTFKRPTLRKFAVGNYLFAITCLNQMALLFLLFKFTQITLGFIDVKSCKAISYLLSVFTRSTYWVTSWVTVNRCLIILFPTSLILKNPIRAIGNIVATLIVVLAMHVHEIIYYKVIKDFSTGTSICVANFGTDLTSRYNRMSTLIHYILTSCIQTISITLLIILASRSRARATGETANFYQVLKKQFETQKELYITPAIMVLSAALQVIVTYSFACKELTDGQRHTLLGAYLLSYAPQVLGFIFYVLPSTSYTKEFGETSFGKTFFKWMFDKETNEFVVSKTIEETKNVM